MQQEEKVNILTQSHKLQKMYFDYAFPVHLAACLKKHLSNLSLKESWKNIEIWPPGGQNHVQLWV